MAQTHRPVIQTRNPLWEKLLILGSKTYGDRKAATEKIYQGFPTALHFVS